MPTFHDLFCGAGGSTLGAALAGATPVLGANHWPVACESYARNHPDTRVDCADIVSTNPGRYPRAQMLLASPECTHHSYARGRPKNDPSLFDPDGDMGAERSRATMWDVVRFAECHRYEAVIVENVEAARKWGATSGMKVPHDGYGPLFAAWLQAMEGLGYRHRVVSLNSLVCGVPQSRDRIYVVFWRKGAREPNLDIRPPAWCSACTRLVEGIQTFKKSGAVAGTYNSQYVYLCPHCARQVAPVITPAAAAIDWSLGAERIGDRAKPLAPATIARIKRGLSRLDTRHDIVTLQQLLQTHPNPDPEQLLASGRSAAVINPGSMKRWPAEQLRKPVDGALVMSNMAHNVPRLANGEPASTVTTGGKLALVYPDDNAVQIDLRANNRPRSAVREPLSTVHAGGTVHGLVAYVVGNYSPGWLRPASRELGTVTASDHHSLLTYRDGVDARSTLEPSSTITTREQHALLGHNKRPSEIPIEDCLFRMLQPHELKVAQGFPSEYELQGNKGDQVAQIGNAVSAPAEKLLVERVIEAIS